jgi:hypothetical protein
LVLPIARDPEIQAAGDELSAFLAQNCGPPPE